MYIVTNRNILKRKGGYSIFGKTPNVQGPNELRLLKVERDGGRRKFTLLNDRLTIEQVKKIKKKYDLDIDPEKEWWASLDVACRIFDEAVKKKKHVLVYVHGYNNDIKDVVKTAEKMESLYNVTVVVFSWPANGGGFFSGTAQYLGDKRDARVSTGALNRFFEKLYNYHDMLTKAQVKSLWSKAKGRYTDNHEQARSEYAKLQQKLCRVGVSLMCHSMGNYVLKYATIPSDTVMTKPIFDNVCLVAADTNNKNHHVWAEKIEARLGVYIVINQNDSALKWSRIKPGEEQLARLGHYLKSLNAQNATYIDVTDVKFVDDEHSYFKDIPVKKNPRLKTLFSDLFEGRRAEKRLVYRSDINAYAFT